MFLIGVTGFSTMSKNEKNVVVADDNGADVVFVRLVGNIVVVVVLLFPEILQGLKGSYTWLGLYLSPRLRRCRDEDDIS